MKGGGAEESLEMTGTALEPFNKFMNYLKQNERLHVAWCVTGIVGCLLLYGALQERIMAEEYIDEDGVAERFTATMFIVMCNRLVTCAVAGTLLLLSGQSILPQAPMWNFVAVSGSNVVATFCQYEALKYVSFPVQTLGKTAKMIPVMIWGALVNQKSYKGKDYFIATMITGGCALFALTGDISSKAAKAVPDSNMYGVILMCGYLGFDGFTSTWQDRMFKGYQMSVYNQILYVQACSAAVSLTSLVAFGQLWTAHAFLSRHPECLWNIIILSLAATMSQLFIFHTIKNFGALLFATVMTTRQFMSILLSCFIYGHLLSTGQSLATLVIFGTLYYKNLSSQKKESKPLPTTQDAEMERLNHGPGEDGKSALERLVAAGGK